MTVLDDIIDTLDFETEVKDIRQGVFHTGVLTRYCGLAATIPRDALKQEPPLVREPGTLLGKTPHDLARMAYSDSILEAAMGMAAINSLLEIKTDRIMEKNAAEIILEKGEGKNVVVIGHFPFLNKVRSIARNLWIMEKNPQNGDFGEDEVEKYMPRAQVAAITGTALTNHSIDRLLDLCDPKAYKIMLGDTVPLSPVLFDYKIDAVSGTRVVDPDLALQCVSQGANFRQIKGVRRLTMYK